MTTWLMLLTCFAVLLFLGVLLSYLFQIGSLLVVIGGSPTSLLAKLRLGLRAIETETEHLPALLVPINQDLTKVGEGLSQANRQLEQTASAALAQKGEA